MITTALAGTLRLARLDPRGMAYFDRSIAGFWHSYRSAIICYPLFLALLVLVVPSANPDAGIAAPNWPQILLVETIGYVIQWTAFALAMLPVSHYLGRQERWLGYIVVYNWSQIVQLSFQLAVMMLIDSGLVPAGPAVLVQVVVLLLYGGFIARVALDINRTAAAMVVLIDFTLGVAIAQIVGALH